MTQIDAGRGSDRQLMKAMVRPSGESLGLQSSLVALAQPAAVA